MAKQLFNELKPIEMFRHNLILIFRNIKRDKSTFLINLIGLSTGLTCALLIFSWVSDELSIDIFHENESRLYEVMQNIEEKDGIETMGNTQGSLAEEMPEVEYAAAVISGYFNNKAVIKTDNKSFPGEEIYAGEDFFNVFSFPLIYGDKDKLLTSKKAVVISDELALKLFNRTGNLVGKTIEWNRKRFEGIYEITGIFKKTPVNSTSRFDLILNYSLFLDKFAWIKEWSSGDPYTYLVLKEGTDFKQLNDKIANFIKTKDKDSDVTLFIREYPDKYLYSNYENGVLTGGRIEYIRLFLIIALFILAIACINFMNLFTAQASRKMKEVGIKKVIGANRKLLMIQIIYESVLISVISLFISLILVEFILPRFNEITGKQLVLEYSVRNILLFTGITFITGIISGIYPAFHISKFNPVKLISKKFTLGSGEVSVQKALVILQFTITVIFIASVIVIYKQTDFIQSKNLGYKKDNIVYFDSYNVSEAFMYELSNIPGVKNISRFFHDLTVNNGLAWGFSWDAQKPGEEEIRFVNLEVGYNFIETF